MKNFLQLQLSEIATDCQVDFKPSPPPVVRRQATDDDNDEEEDDDIPAVPMDLMAAVESLMGGPFDYAGNNGTILLNDPQ